MASLFFFAVFLRCKLAQPRLLSIDTCAVDAWRSKSRPVHSHGRLDIESMRIRHNRSGVDPLASLEFICNPSHHAFATQFLEAGKAVANIAR